MSLSGSAIGNVLASAVGAPPAAAGFFGLVGGVIASWAPANIQVLPVAMAASGGAVSGFGAFKVLGSKEDLGSKLCAALGIPPTATSSVAKWTIIAGALINHFNTQGKANGTGFSAGTPLTGAGTLVWASPVFAPLLSSQMAMTEAVSSALVDAFGATLLAYLQTNASVVSLSLSGPPLSAPPTGAVVGTGTIA